MTDSEEAAAATLDRTYDISATSEWITSNGHRRVTLQFPDAMLADSWRVCEALKRLSGRSEVYVSVDTTYSSCCVDDISARHVDADAIVHYGHACMSPTTSMVYYVHPKAPLDVRAVAEHFSSMHDPIVFYHSSFHHLFERLTAAVFEACPSAVVAALHRESPLDHKLTFGRRLLDRHSNLVNVDSFKDRTVVYIGGDDQTAFNLAVSSGTRGVLVVDPASPSRAPQPYSQSAWLRRRRYVVERCRDAKNIGVLVCTLSTANFASIIERLRTLIAAAGKKCYVLTLGRPNVAKLANLYEIDVFALIACPENDLYSRRDFLAPLAYPFEVELALNRRRDPYAEDYFTDFNDLLDGGRGHCQIEAAAADESDVSLITGRVRNNAKMSDDEVDGGARSSEIAARHDMTVATTVGNHLSERSWTGLEQRLGETKVEDVQTGRRGIAGKYESEPQ